MKKKVFLATHNEGKIERYKNLLEWAGLNVSIFTPKDFGLEHIEPEETGKILVENAKIKACAYFGKVDLPILANDTGYWVEGEGLIDTPKRTALGAINENTLTKKEIATVLTEFWKNIAKKHGGMVDAAWIEEFVLLDTNGKMYVAESRREVIMTDQEFGEPHVEMPVRALYISKETNKPAVWHTKEEEALELKPIADAIKNLLNET